MKKICFISDSFLWEEKIRPVLHRAISHVIEQNDAVEFWFHTLREPFLQEAVIAIPEIRKSFPEKQVAVVAVVDPLRKMELERTDDQMLHTDGFQENSVDRVEYAPLFDGKCEKNATHFIQHFYKVNQWMYRQCDEVIAYFYDNLPTSLSKCASSILMGKSRLPYQHIYLPETRALIDSQIAQLSEKEKYFMQKMNQGVSCAALAREFGISYNRVLQYATRAKRRICGYIPKD